MHSDQVGREHDVEESSFTSMTTSTRPLHHAERTFRQILTRVGAGFVLLLIALNVAPEEAADPGVLIRVTMDSRVGVLLDEIPSSLRDQIVDSLLRRPQGFWHNLAQMQIEYTLHRLINRAAHYPDSNKFQLPLPPPQVWEVT